MKAVFLLTILFLSFCTGFGQVADKTYTLSKYFIVANNDSLIYYSRDSLENIWDMKHVSIHFNAENTYIGNSINNTSKVGTWSITNNKFITDKDTSEIVKADSYVLLIRNRFVFTTDSTQTEGQLITEFINYVYSVKSGDWNDPGTWSCNCIPQETDNVLIKINTKVLLTTAMGIQKCKHLTVEWGAAFDNTGSFFQAKP